MTITNWRGRAMEASSEHAIAARRFLILAAHDSGASDGTVRRATAIYRDIPLQPATSADLDLLRHAATGVAQIRTDEEVLNGWIAQHHLSTALTLLETARSILNTALNRDNPDN